MFDLYKTIGFTGAQAMHPNRAEVMRDLARKAQKARATVLLGWGTAEGVRRAVPTARVISIRDYYRIPKARDRFAARSAALVQALVSQSPRSVLIAFPGEPCPQVVKPCRNPFKGHESQTWATVALAVSYGIPVFVFPGFRVTPPLPPTWGEWTPITWGSPFGDVAGASILSQSLRVQFAYLAPLPADLDDRHAYLAATYSGIQPF